MMNLTIDASRAADGGLRAVGPGRRRRWWRRRWRRWRRRERDGDSERQRDRLRGQARRGCLALQLRAVDERGARRGHNRRVFTVSARNAAETRAKSSLQIPACTVQQIIARTPARTPAEIPAKDAREAEREWREVGAVERDERAGGMRRRQRREGRLGARDIRRARSVMICEELACATPRARRHRARRKDGGEAPARLTVGDRQRHRHDLVARRCDAPHEIDGFELRGNSVLGVAKDTL
eukprot:6085276-Pleurochrysis_carterae.AAC.1